MNVLVTLFRKFIRTDNVLKCMTLRTDKFAEYHHYERGNLLFDSDFYFFNSILKKSISSFEIILRDDVFHNFVIIKMYKIIG